ncbi:MAG: hypothetical protein R3346_03685 [Candidatus Spechtbacterales bacterium]|nr:hypothetical protein [Candidatus Spechtbacterales bacterium]
MTSLVIRDKDIDTAVSVTFDLDEELSDKFLHSLYSSNAVALYKGMNHLAVVTGFREGLKNEQLRESYRVQFEQGVLMFVGAVWSALGHRLPTISPESLEQFRENTSIFDVEDIRCDIEKINKKLALMIEEIARMFSDRVCMCDMYVLCKVLMDAVEGEKTLRETSVEEVVLAAERILRS